MSKTYTYTDEKQMLRGTVDEFKDNLIFCEILNYLFRSNNYKESNYLKLNYYISRNLDKKLVDREVKKIDDYIREIYDSSISLIPNFTTDRPVISDYRIINAYEFDYDAEEKEITIKIYINTKLLKNIKEFLSTDLKQLFELSKYIANFERIYREWEINEI